MAAEANPEDEQERRKCEQQVSEKVLTSEFSLAISKDV